MAEREASVSLTDVHADIRELADSKDEKLREELFRANTKINTLERRLAQMERRFLALAGAVDPADSKKDVKAPGEDKARAEEGKKEGEEKKRRVGWDTFKLTATKHESNVAVSNQGKTVANTTGGGRVVTIWGEALWTKGKHSFRIKLDKGNNVFVGVLPAGKDVDKLASVFVGEARGVGLHSTSGSVYMDGKEYFLGDYARAYEGDDVGVNVDLDKRTMQFFKNGAPLCRPFVLPKYQGGISPAVTLPNRDDTVTIFFTHPEDE